MPVPRWVLAATAAVLLGGCGQSALPMAKTIHGLNMNSLPTLISTGLESDFVQQAPETFVSVAEKYCGQGSYVGSATLPGTVALFHGLHGSMIIYWLLPCSKGVLTDSFASTHGNMPVEFMISQDGRHLTPMNPWAKAIENRFYY